MKTNGHGHLDHPPEPAAQGIGALPGVEEVFRFAEQEVGLAAAELWPSAVVEFGEHVPSVTGYVRRIVVGRRVLYAKYVFLSVSLVSLLRGACGGWPQVLKEQPAYVARTDALLEREAAQLRLLARMRHPRSPRWSSRCARPSPTPASGMCVWAVPPRTPR